jgi:hypothetical protein
MDRAGSAITCVAMVCSQIAVIGSNQYVKREPGCELGTSRAYTVSVINGFIARVSYVRAWAIRVVALDRRVPSSGLRGTVVNCLARQRDSHPHALTVLRKVLLCT